MSLECIYGPSYVLFYSETDLELLSRRIRDKKERISQIVTRMKKRSRAVDEEYGPSAYLPGLPPWL